MRKDFGAELESKETWKRTRGIKEEEKKKRRGELGITMEGGSKV